jgi:hypothetical protein
MVISTFLTTLKKIIHKIYAMKLRHSLFAMGLVLIMQLLCAASFVGANNDTVNLTKDSNKEAVDPKKNDQKPNADADAEKNINTNQKDNDKPADFKKHKFRFKNEGIDEEELKGKIKKASDEAIQNTEKHKKDFCENYKSDTNFDSKKEQLEKYCLELQKNKETMDNILQSNSSTPADAPK